MTSPPSSNSLGIPDHPEGRPRMMLNQDLASSNESSPQLNHVNDNSDGRSGLSSDSDAEEELFYDKEANTMAVVPNGIIHEFTKSEEETHRKVPLVKYLSEEEKPSTSQSDEQQPSTSQEEPQERPNESEAEPNVEDGDSEEDVDAEPPAKQPRVVGGPPTNSQRITRSRTRQSNGKSVDQNTGNSSS
ncbi:unnamed protein product [Bursaphelenchus okinawaensis]|uniref:Uncharacterized protein n=1 Tax=Bursaphelenchus okinawaensis TaxID=465554 RepID=A0A811KIA1_9BILA|nr:unnamed protein product [Bursaphelenchus okinawaensis]CAG9105171.1 unnamed protein product [Bursaphelenchus okinawaensis]